jgi:hypothetical protein
MTSKRAGVKALGAAAALIGTSMLVAITGGCGPKTAETADGGSASGTGSKVPPPQPAYSKTGQRMQAAPPGFAGAPGGAPGAPPPGPAPH